MARKATTTTTKKTTTAKKAAPKKAGATAKAGPKKAAPGKTATRRAAAKKGNGGLTLALPQELAGALARAAVQLDTAKNGGELGAALELNMDTWVSIRALARSPEGNLPQETRNHLDRLADYVISTTLSSGATGTPLTDDQVKSLINVDLQISEGLLEGYAAERVREEAYRLWEGDGRPDGNDQFYWYEAEKKVRDELGL